ncbi:hypothetical protein, partial [Streptomyces violascens]|uniref:hypothetical protein n=1 Tax=Streptomyces violascens TaxID=67381 RepID=UPI0036A8BA85
MAGQAHQSGEAAGASSPEGEDARARERNAPAAPADMRQCAPRGRRRLLHNCAASMTIVSASLCRCAAADTIGSSSGVVSPRELSRP